MVVVFNATFHNNSVILQRSVLLVEKPGVPGENHRPVALANFTNHSQYKIYHLEKKKIRIRIDKTIPALKHDIKMKQNILKKSKITNSSTRIRCCKKFRFNQLGKVSDTEKSIHASRDDNGFNECCMHGTVLLLPALHQPSI